MAAIQAIQGPTLGTVNGEAFPLNEARPPHVWTRGEHVSSCTKSSETVGGRRIVSNYLAWVRHDWLSSLALSQPQQPGSSFFTQKFPPDVLFVRTFLRFPGMLRVLGRSYFGYFFYAHLWRTQRNKRFSDGCIKEPAILNGIYVHDVEKTLFSSSTFLKRRGHTAAHIEE